LEKENQFEVLLSERRTSMKNQLLYQELLAIFRNKKLLIPIIAVLFIPVLYSGMFLWAFWNPYEHLSDLPVAVVNEDQGAVIDGKNLELGDNLIQKLKESKDFGFEFVDEAKGRKGLKNQEYYMLIEIPENFSENASTLMEEEPKKLELVYIPNESFNFLSAQIGETAAERIKVSVSEKVSETYAETMFGKIGELADGLDKASDGASEITVGAEKVKAGSKELYDNLELLAGKSIEFSDGMSTASSSTKQLAKGAHDLTAGLTQLEEGHKKLQTASDDLLQGEKQLAEGAVELKAGMKTANSSISSLVDGTSAIKQGSDQLAQNLTAWKSGSDSAAAGAAELHAGIQELQAQLQKMQPLLSSYPEQQKQLSGALEKLETGSAGLAEGTKELSGSAAKLEGGAQKLSGSLGELMLGQQKFQQGIGALSAGSEKMETGIHTLQSGQEQFNSGMYTFGDKLQEAKNGSVKLSEGTSKLAGGIKQLSAGSSAMTAGAGQLAEGAGKIADANGKIADGTSNLQEKLAAGAEEAKITPDKDTYNMMASPVKLEKEKINSVPNYGTGFAPYFLSLGLFVGALLLSIVFPLREPAGVPASGLNWFRSKFAVLAGIGIIQAIMADAILIIGLGLNVKSLPLFLVFSIITSITFIALVQFLVTTLADPGRFVAIIVLILQLTTSAGTFPLELIPEFLQKFNAFLPMTYTVQGFKAVISSGDFSFMWQNAGILAGYIAALSLGTWLYFHLMHKRKFAAAAEQK
jgi:putative membrane protein